MVYRRKKHQPAFIGHNDNERRKLEHLINTENLEEKRARRRQMTITDNDGQS